MNFPIILKSITLVLFFPVVCFSQKSDTSQSPILPKLLSGTKSFRTWAIGIHTGATNASVGIGGRNDFQNNRYSMAYGFYLKRQLSHAFGIRAEFFKGSLEGGAYSTSNNPYASFLTNIKWAASINGLVTFNNVSWTRERTFMQPFLRFGAGKLGFNTILTDQAGVSFNYKGDSLVQRMFIPVGIGFKFNISNTVNFEVGYTMNFVDSDDIDGYVGPQVANDRFSYSYIGLQFSLGKKNKQQLSVHNPIGQMMKDLKVKSDLFDISIQRSEHILNQLKQDTAALNRLSLNMDRMQKDADQDGVSDFFDKCPGTPANEKTDGAGCPLPVMGNIKNITIYEGSEADKKVIQDAFDHLEFDFGKSRIRISSLASLRRLAKYLIDNRLGVKLSGHTDNIGSDEKNLILSEDRVQSVKVFLIIQGVNPMHIEAKGFGETQPEFTNETETGRSKNRRVVFSFFKPEEIK